MPSALPNPPAEVDCDSRGEEVGWDGVGVAFAVGGVEGANYLLFPSVALESRTRQRCLCCRFWQPHGVIPVNHGLYTDYFKFRRNMAPLCTQEVISCCILLSPPDTLLRRLI